MGGLVPLLGLDVDGNNPLPGGGELQMPKLTRRSVVAGAAATILAPYLAVGREIGVKHAQYSIGDVRRYGVFPDGETDWGTIGLSNVIDNALNGAEVFWPKGLYRTNMQIAKSNVSFFFEEGAEFAGTIHVNAPDGAPKRTYIENVMFRGHVALYDRLGTIDVRKFSADKVTMRSDADVNYYKNRGRGVHIYRGCRDFRISEVIVDNTETQVFQPNNWAAVSIDGWPDHPKRIKIGRVHVKASRTHGFYAMGPDHDFGEIVVDDCLWGPLTKATQEGIRVDTGDGCAVMFNKASGRAGKIKVSAPAGNKPCFPVAVANYPKRTSKIFPAGMEINEVHLRGRFRNGVVVGLGGGVSYTKIGSIFCETGTIIANYDRTSSIENQRYPPEGLLSYGDQRE